MAVALAVVQQAVELLGAAGDGGGFQPTVIGRAVAGFQAGADVLAGLDDVVRVEGVVADGALYGITVLTQPTGLRCRFQGSTSADGSDTAGTMGSAATTAATLDCTPQ